MTKETAVQITFFLLRVVAGLLFMHHGGQKLFGWFGGSPAGNPAAWSQVWIAGVLEFYGGLLIMLGLLTRFTAFIVSGEMAVAYFQAHQPKGTWPIQNGGELAALYAFIFLFIAAYGAGPWSLDALFWRRRKTTDAGNIEPT